MSSSRSGWSRHPTIALLRDLVALDSVNPRLVPGASGEREVGQHIATQLRRYGLDVETYEVEPGRPNVLGVLEGRRPGPTLMLCGHTDTVGVEGMVAPFEPREHEGRLYGRGAQDMKSGVAAMVGAAGELAASGGLTAGRLVVAAVVDEEHASLGAEALGDRPADGAVVTEPTDLAIATAHKGFSWVDIETHGRAAHGSRPADGRDAILRMGRVLAELERMDRDLQRRPGHPMLGTPSLHASAISGGREPSVYPDRCSLTLERRTVVGEPDDVAMAEVSELLLKLKQQDPEFEGHATTVLSRPPYELSTTHSLVTSLGSIARRHGLSPEPTGMSFWTDAAVLSRARVPTVLFGPRGAGLHSAEEFVELDSVLTCQDILVDLARTFCAGAPHGVAVRTNPKG